MGNVIHIKPKQVEYGVFYHHFVKQLTTKYGTDYRFNQLIDLEKLTDEELAKFCNLYREMNNARGIDNKRIDGVLKRLIAESMLNKGCPANG